MIQGAAYIRVSTDDQIEYSPEAQLRALREYSKKNEIVLLDEFIFRDEGISGRKASKRPGFQAMISAAKKKPKPFDVILVHKFDRFARNREDSVVYKSLLRRECNIKVVSITEQLEDDKFSVIMESMLEAMAEYYSLNLADEVKKGMFEKARRGENIGKASYGYVLVDSKLVPHERESQIVKTIFEMAKTESLSKISHYLNNSGAATKTGGNWTPLTVKYILQNPVYYGVTRYNYCKGGRRDMQNPPSEWILAESNHIPLIDKEVFELIQKRLELNSNLFGRNFSEKSLKSWLQHISRCSECGGTLTVSTCDNKKYKMFRCCRNRIGVCNVGNTWSARKLEKLVASRLNTDSNNLEALTVVKVSTKNDTALIDELNNQLKKVEHKYSLIKKAYLAEIDSLSEYKANKEQLKKEEEKIKQQIAGLTENTSVDNKKSLRLSNFLKALSDNSVPVEDQNKIAKQFIKEVRVDLKAKDISIIYYI